MWVPVILALIELFGPVLVEWIKKWLESRLTTAGTHLPPPETFATPQLAQLALLEQAMRSLPYRAFARRALLRLLKSIVLRDGVITDDDKQQINDLSGAINNE